MLLEAKRVELGLGPIGSDQNTVAILLADDKEYTGTNGGDWKTIQFKNLARSGIHAEIDALNQLFMDRQESGIQGGGGKMLVDRQPCQPFCLTIYGNGNIVKAVSQIHLDYLELRYSGGISTILALEFLGTVN